MAKHDVLKHHKQYSPRRHPDKHVYARVRVASTCVEPVMFCAILLQTESVADIGRDWRRGRRQVGPGLVSAARLARRLPMHMEGH